MNVLSTMEKQVQMLEMVSEAEESVTLDTEQEEGEIIDDDDDDFAPERRTSNNSSSVTSEVVIYDDHGRTAIFTSPKKTKSGRDPSSYPRVPEGVRRWARDDINKRREKDEGDSKHQKDTDKGRRRQNAQFEIVESGFKKKSKRKHQTGMKVREVKKAEDATAEDHKTHKIKVPHDSSHKHNARHRSPSSSSDSESSTCSCSCSDDDSSPRPQRGRGKENKRSGSLSGVHSRSPLHSGHTRPTLQSSSSKQPPLLKPHSQKSSTKSASPHRSPPNQRKDVYRKSPPSHSSHKFPKDLSRSRTYSHPNYCSYTKQNKTNKKRSNTLDDEKASFRIDQSSKEKTNDHILMKGQKQPPPGSLGEMLLKKTRKGKLKVHPEAGEASVVILNKDNELVKSVVDKEGVVGESSTDLGQECYTLDQEDEDELQLRLIALQSSLRVLSDVRKEGQQDMLCGLSLIEKFTRTEENKGKRGENLSGQEYSDQLQPHREKFPFISTLENSLLQNRLKKSSHYPVEVVEQLNEGGKYGKRDCGQYDNVGDFEISLYQFNQDSVRSVSAPNSPECEFEIEAIHTNKSYMDAIDNSNHLVGNKVEDILGDTKELSDCNQDPVDMDICDSSAGEEDDDTLDEELFQEVGEDIAVDNKNSPATPVMIINDVLNSCPDNRKEGSSGPEGSQPASNFQMPVEWAYMMPPPPPPDQPVNDISNINNWCYDQNMYLQSMQAPYDTSDHYSHYNMQGGSNADWGQQHSQSSQWSCPVNNDLESDSADVAFELPKSSASEEGDTSDKDNMENSDVTEPQKDLKDLPAEQYQAFMSLVLKQQTAQPQHITTSDAPQRNLIEVPLLKNTNDTKHLTDQWNNRLVSKRSEARRRKRERQKKIKLVKKKQGVKKRWGGRKLEPVVIGIEPQQMADSVTEEEDEDLLRAKLLIDLSRKKQQKAVESTIGHQVTASGEKRMCIAKEVCENTPPREIPSSSESSPVPRPHGGKAALLKNVHLQKSRIKEGSPTQMSRMDTRPGLSDIGGFGLDPKSSRYDFPISNDPSAHSDVTKFKFPPVKPVIINLNSDSEEEFEEGGVKAQTSYEGFKKEAESEASSIGMISSSIDHLLKVMRNAKPSGEGKSTQDKPGSSGASSSGRLKPKATSVDSTPSVVRHLSRTQQMEYHRLKEQLRKKELLHRRRQLQQQRPLAATRSKPVALSTQLVTLSASPKSAGKCSGPSTGATRASLGGDRYNKMDSSSPERDNDLALFESEKLFGASGSGGISGSREVSWKEMGMLQIQLPNVGSCDDHSSVTSVEDSCEGGKNEHHIANVNDPAIADESSQEIFTGEDEDEETLRKMVLQTLQKKISERAKAEKLPGTRTAEEENSKNLVTAPKDKYVANVPELSPAVTTLKVVIHQKVDEVTVNEAIQEGSSDHCSARKVVMEEQSEVENSKEGSSDRCSVRKVVIEEQNEVENSKDIHERPHDEDMSGEWMVLDEVLEEGSEGNGCCHNSDGEDGGQCSTIANTDINTEISKEDSSGVSHDSQINNDGHTMLDKTSAMFKEKVCNQVINEDGKTIEKGKKIIHDSLTVVCTSKQEDSSLEGKQQVCVRIDVVKEEEMQKKAGGNLDVQKGCKGNMICSENRSIVIDDAKFRTGAPGLLPNEKCEETQRQHTSKTCENGENFLTERDNRSTGLSAQTVTCISYSINAKQVGTHSSKCDNEKEMKCTGSLQHLSKLRNYKDEGPSSHKNNTCTSAMVKIKQHSHDPPMGNPEKSPSCSCHKIGQEKAKGPRDDSKMDLSSVEVKDFCQGTKETGREPEKGFSGMQKPQPWEVLIKLKGQDDTNLKNKCISTTKGRTDRNKTQMQESANDSTNFSDFVKHPTGHSSGMGTVAEDCDPKAPGRENDEGKSEKLVKTKRLLILKRIEHDYSEKRTSMNKVISQLTSLVQEATQEERQRQSHKKSVMQLSEQLKEMEAQLETKSRALKTKMARIRALQTQLTTDRQFISELERKGKLLGQQEFGSSYTLPKVLGSPNSKTKDALRKKQLASNIDALRQQIRDVSNRSRARLEVAAQAEDIHENIKRRGKPIKKMENSSKDFKQTEEIGSQNRQVGSSGVNSQGNIKTAVENLLQGEAAEENINQKCSKEVPNNSLQAQEKVPLVEATAAEKIINVIQKFPQSSGRILAKFAKTNDARGSNLHHEREIDNVEEDPLSAVKSKKVDEQIPKNLSTADSNRVEDGEMLDEMNVLCPYDLLGRCNDDFCMYQHLAQPRNGSHYLMKPSASLTMKTGGHMLRSHLETRTGVDTGMGWRESRSGIGKMEPDTEIGRRGPDSGKETMGPETGTGRTRLDIGIGKTTQETRIVKMEQDTGIRSTGPDIGTGMMGPHTGIVGIKPDTGSVGIEPDTGTEGIEPDTGTRRIEPVTGTLRIGPDSETRMVGADTGIGGIGLNTRTGKMGQDTGSGSDNETVGMGSDTGKWMVPETGKGEIGLDTGKGGMGQDTRRGGTSQNNVTDRLRPDDGSGSTDLDIGLGRIETDNETGRTGPETRMRRTVSADTGTEKTRQDAGLESTGPDSGVGRMEIDNGTGRTGPKTRMSRIGPYTVEENIDKRLMPASNTQPMEDESGSGLCGKIIPASSSLENKCLGWENQAKSDIKHDINASSNLSVNSLYTTFRKKEVPSVIHHEKKHKNYKRKRDNEDDSLLVNSGICLSVEEEEEEAARNKKTKILRAVNAVIANNDMPIKEIVDKDPDLNTIVVMDVEDCGTKSVTDLQFVSTDMLNDLKYVKDIESSSSEMSCMMTPEAAKPQLEGQVHNDQKVIVQEYEEEGKRKDEIPSDTITKKNTLEQTEAFEKPVEEQPKEQQPQLNRLNLESKVLNKEDKKNKVRMNEKLLETIDEPCKSLDSDADVSHRKRPATRKMTKVVGDANSNENSNTVATDHITTRRRGQELASRENRRGRSKGSTKNFSKGGPSNCSEDNGAGQRGPKRRAAHQKKNRGRNSVSRGRKK